MTRRLVVLALLAFPAAAQAASPPSIPAPDAIVVDAQTGDIAYAKNPDAEHPIASTTKLMTALLTLEHGGLSAVVTAPRYRAAPAESVLGLVKGEQITEADLLRGLLGYSANDTAVALAAHVGGSVPAFVRMMNRRAVQLGLHHTHYANPIGLDEQGNYSSARDLATLTRTLRKHRFFRRTVNTNDFTLRSGIRPRTFTNRNTLLAEYPWIDGVKTGYTSQAHNVLVASGTKRGVHLISVVIGAASKTERNADSLALLNYGFTKYRLARAIVAGDHVSSVPIRDRPGADLPVLAGRTVRKVKRVNERFTYRAELPDHVTGPISYGQKIGHEVISLRKRVVARVPLTAALDVPRASGARRVQDLLTRPWILIVLGALLVLGALFVQRRPPGREAAT